jgi:cytochrome c oxidase subunit 2
MSWWFVLPENIATYGPELDRLYYLIYFITGAFFFLVSGLMVAFLVMYRERPGRRATYSHGHTTLELLWTIVPALILIVPRSRPPVRHRR